MRKFATITSILMVIIIIAISCKNDYTPKPRGYFRITFPEKKYQQLDSIYPFKFEYPVYSTILKDPSPYAEPYWFNLHFPSMRGDVHISYKSITNNLVILEEDSRNLAYKHTIKADAINEKLYLSPDKNVYGIYYEIKGNAASSVQFYLTDSVDHFLRGSLYFNVAPNKDSLSPVVDYISKDIQHLMETFEWKN